MYICFLCVLLLHEFVLACIKIELKCLHIRCLFQLDFFPILHMRTYNSSGTSDLLLYGDSVCSEMVCYTDGLLPTCLGFSYYMIQLYTI